MKQFVQNNNSRKGSKINYAASQEIARLVGYASIAKPIITAYERIKETTLFLVKLQEEGLQRHWEWSC